MPISIDFIKFVQSLSVMQIFFVFIDIIVSISLEFVGEIQNGFINSHRMIILRSIYGHSSKVSFGHIILVQCLQNIFKIH